MRNSHYAVDILRRCLRHPSHAPSARIVQGLPDSFLASALRSLNVIENRRLCRLIVRLGRSASLFDAMDRSAAGYFLSCLSLEDILVLSAELEGARRARVHALLPKRRRKALKRTEAECGATPGLSIFARRFSAVVEPAGCNCAGLGAIEGGGHGRRAEFSTASADVVSDGQASTSSSAGWSFRAFVRDWAARRAMLGRY